MKSLNSTGGFSLIELMIGLVSSLIVLGAAFTLYDSQARLYTVQRETMDARESLRAAAALVSWELMNLSASDSGFYAITSSSFDLRSIQGTGVVCSRATVGFAERFGLQQVSGYFEASADDSVRVYSAGADGWDVLKVAAAWNGSDAWSGGGTPVCFWGDSTTSVPRPQATLELQGDSAVLANIRVGAPIRAFRRTEYAVFQEDGRWWLGRRVGSASGYDKLTGPMLAPAQGGLALTYYDTTGSVTAALDQIARVDLVLRAESFKRVRKLGGGNTTLNDSLTTVVFLRNNVAQ